MSVYRELRGFVLAHLNGVRGHDEPRRVYRPSNYSVLVRCGCGQQFTRWVTPEDADEDRVRSALLAFES